MAKTKTRPQTPDPRVVGGRYLCGYWRQEYTVLAITHHEDWRGLSWTCKWADGHVTEHSTAWDWKRDRMLEHPDDIMDEGEAYCASALVDRMDDGL